jgi:hypothetical protein
VDADGDVDGEDGAGALRGCGRLLLASACILLFAVQVNVGLGAEEVAGNPEIRGDGIRVEFDLENRCWNLEAMPYGEARSLITETRIAASSTGRERRGEHSSRTSDPYVVRTEISSVRDESGAGSRLTVYLDGIEGAPDYVLRATVFPGHAFVIFDGSISNNIGRLIAIQRVSLWKTDDGLDLGLRDERPPAILLDSGTFNGSFVGHVGEDSVTSNGLVAIHNPAGATSFVCGFLDLDRGDCQIGVRAAKPRAALSLDAAWPQAHVLQPGSTLAFPRLFAMFHPSPHENLEIYASVVRSVLDPPLPGTIPVLWTSWYSHRWRITEKSILMQAAILDSLYRDYGFKYVQLDHGWQFGWQPSEGIYASSVWEPNGRFPHGLPWLRKKLASQNLKLGLWISPNAVDPRDPIARQHPDAVTEGGLNGLNESSPAVLEFWRATGRKLKSYGTEYLKIDFGASRAATGILREELGPEALFVSSGSRSNALAGCFNMVGAHRDVGNGLGDFVHLKGYLRDVSCHWFKNGRFWLNSVDALIVGDPGETPGEARVRCTIVGLSGSNAMLGDNMVRLAHNRPDRLAMIAMVLPPSGLTARPVDLFRSAGSYPRLWSLPVRTPWAEWTIVAVFNLGEDPLRETVRIDEIGLLEGQEHLVFDFWRQEFAGSVNGDFDVMVPPGDVRVLAVRATPSRPTVLATDMHLTMGYVELRDVRWDSKRARLSGECRRAPGTKGSLFIYVPEGYRPVKGDSRSVEIQMVSDRMARAYLNLHKGAMKWSIDFESGEPQFSTPEGIRNVLMEISTDTAESDLYTAEALLDSLIRRSSNLAAPAWGARLMVPTPIGKLSAINLNDGCTDCSEECFPASVPARLEITWPDSVNLNTVVLHHSFENLSANDWTVEVPGEKGWVDVASLSNYPGYPRMTVQVFPRVVTTALRLSLKPKSTASVLCLQEIEVYDLPPAIPGKVSWLHSMAAATRQAARADVHFGPNLARTASLRASSENGMASLNNGNTTVMSGWEGGPQHAEAGWQAGGSEAWIELDWGTPRTFNMLALHHPDTAYASDWQVEVDVDSAWAPLLAVSGYEGESYRGFDGVPLSRRTVHMVPETTARRIRLKLTRNAAVPFRIVEIELYNAHPLVRADFAEFLASEKMTDGDAGRVFGD